MSVATQAKERPIRCNATEVLAIIEGRKTQTRRIIKPQPEGSTTWLPYCEETDCGFYPNNTKATPARLACPFGKPGDRLWVREAFRLYDSIAECGCYDACQCCRYHGKPVFRADCDDSEAKWKPSIHMPRWASRITLEIVSVHVERLQNISEADAVAEGCKRIDLSPRVIDGVQVHPLTSTYFAAFAEQWCSINGPESWSANPWVWVGRFRVVN